MREKIILSHNKFRCIKNIWDSLIRFWIIYYIIILIEYLEWLIEASWYDKPAHGFYSMVRLLNSTKIRSLLWQTNLPTSPTTNFSIITLVRINKVMRIFYCTCSLWILWIFVSGLFKDSNMRTWQGV